MRAFILVSAVISSAILQVNGQEVKFSKDSVDVDADSDSVSVDNPDARGSKPGSKFFPGFGFGGPGLNGINPGSGGGFGGGFGQQGLCLNCQMQPQIAMQCCQTGFQQCCFGFGGGINPGFGGGFNNGFGGIGGIGGGGIIGGGFGGGFGAGIKPGACPSFMDSLINLRRRRQTVSFGEESETETATAATAQEGAEGAVLRNEGARSIDGKGAEPNTRFLGAIFGQKCRSDFECQGAQKCCTTGLGFTAICKNAVIVG